jgi:hypothetical protein
MPYLPERTIDEHATQSRTRQMVLIAPAGAELPRALATPCVVPALRQSVLADVQRLRGRIYFEDGALSAHQLTPDGRHVQAVDDHSWHLVVLSGRGEVSGCVRYWQPGRLASFAELSVAGCALFRNSTWGGRFKRAVESQREEARCRGIGYAELGGWALSEELRYSAYAVRMAISLYGLARILGGTIAISTATTRHHSSDILKRIGGRPLSVDGVELPPYYDPQYGCDMEVLRFDSSIPNTKFQSGLERSSVELTRIPVLSSGSDSDFVNSLENLRVAVAQQTTTAPITYAAQVA